MNNSRMVRKLLALLLLTTGLIQSVWTQENYIDFPRFDYAVPENAYYADKNILRYLQPVYDKPDNDHFDYEYLTDNEKNMALENALNLLDLPAEAEKQEKQIEKRLLSPFRERMEENRNKEEENKATDEFLNKLRQEAIEREVVFEPDEDYVQILQKLLHKYKTHVKNGDYELMKDQEMKYPIRYRSAFSEAPEYNKRTYKTEPESVGTLYFLNYPNGLAPDDESEVQSNRYYYEGSEGHRKSRANRGSGMKHKFLVAKRSSNFYNNRHKKNEKQNTSSGGTDPKVAKDLSEVFGTKYNGKKHREQYIYKNKSNKKKKTETVTSTTEKSTTMHQGEEVAKEEVKDAPLQIKKKSIDWSNYFGIDRRKKSETGTSDNDVNNEWLLERYHKTLKMATKRNSWKNDNITDDEEFLEGGKDQGITDKAKLENMNAKLKNIEDLIVDDALKFTGAHQGTSDSKELQEVKDRLISRLAAAYSLEKMRKALNEFKMSIDAQKFSMSRGQNNKKNGVPEKKNDLENSEDDKYQSLCSDSSCNDEHEYQNFEEHSKELENSIGKSCSSIKLQCQSVTGHQHGGLFYGLCYWHQLCYLCSYNDPRMLLDCDVQFTLEANTLCHEDTSCRQMAKSTVKYLRELHDETPSRLYENCNRSICEPDLADDFDTTSLIRE